MKDQQPLSNDLFQSDPVFDGLYTLRAQQLSAIHWTPIEVAKKAAAHLTEGNKGRILDIGSGVGKFCIVAAHYFPQHSFYGVEQRKALIDEAVIAQKATCTNNVTFIHSNFNAIDLQHYDHFYFYNSFSENLFHYKPIDNLIQASPAIYDEYLNELYNLLEEKPAGTRLATFHSPEAAVPPSYHRIKYVTGESLELWIKS